MIQSFNYLLTLRQDPALYTACSVTLVTTHNNALAAWEAFRKSVTQWVRETTNGAEAWESSVEDFNIGDFQDVHADDEFLAIAESHGLTAVLTQITAYDGFRDFDEVLVNRHELQPSTQP